MITTSLKSLEEIRTGSLISLPRDINFEAWYSAWSSTCTGIKCEGIKPYFWNSILIAIPAVLISTLIGAVNGYIVAQWKFYGSNLIFTNAFWLLHTFPSYLITNGAITRSNEFGWFYTRIDLCSCDLWHWLYNTIF